MMAGATAWALKFGAVVSSLYGVMAGAAPPLAGGGWGEGAVEHLRTYPLSQPPPARGGGGFIRP
jgi:hypothetical protein